MNSRLVTLLEQLFDGKPRKLVELELPLGMTSRAIKYHIRVINAFLLREGIPQISIHRSQVITWSITPNESAKVKRRIANFSPDTFQLRTDERQILITLILMASDQNPLNEELAHLLGVSKSTVDKDFQRLSRTLLASGINLNRHLRNGCQLIANEQDLRNHSIKLIISCLDFYNPLQETDLATNPKERIVRELFLDGYAGPILEILKIIEAEYLPHELSLPLIRLLLLNLVVAVVRIKNGHLLPMNLDQQVKLRKSKEHLWAIKICSLVEKEFGIVFPESERLNIAFLLSGVCYEMVHSNTCENWTEVQIVISKMIQSMSYLMNVDFSKDQCLYRALQSHLNLTTFNLKHQIPIVNPALDEIRRYYPFCFECLKKVLVEIDSSLTMGMSEDEVAYLVLHFSASLERQKRMLPSARVAIVCVHGAGTASLLRESLCTRFLNLHVVAVLTLSDLDLIHDLEVDFVISTIRLDNCSAPYLQVDPLPSENDFSEVGKMLIKHVRQTESQSNTQNLFLEIIASIDKIIPIDQQENLTKVVAATFEQHGYPVQISKPTKKLSDLLTSDKIRNGLTAYDWQNAVLQTANVLLETGDITLDFVESTIRTVSSAGPYIVISRGVALVHSGIGEGVNNLAMSLGTFPEGVRFNHPLHDPVRLVFCLAPVDKDSHLEALHGIIELFDQTNEQELIAISSPEGLHNFMVSLGV